MTDPGSAIVFLGPSLPREEAQGILAAEYRPPVRRGDLEQLVPGTVVGIIDGVFEQDLAVSPAEIHRAVQRGVVVFGGSSMGALRAAEVHGVKGVGQVYQWVRDGTVSRDDEVALLFDPLRHRPITVPTVCVRFSAERLRRMGTLEADTARALIDAAERLSFKDRTYPRILAEAGLSERADSEDLIAMLSAQDIKRSDAQAVLEAIDLHLKGVEVHRPPTTEPGSTAEPALARSEPPSNDILIWESGDRITPQSLLQFLAFTGHSAVSQLLPGRTEQEFDGEHLQHAAQKHFVSAAKRWGWLSSEEAEVTLSDLGLDASDLGEASAAKAAREMHARKAFRTGNGALATGLCAGMLLDDMTLKRETLRAGALDWIAARSTEEPNETAIQGAKDTLTRVFNRQRFSEVVTVLREFGIEEGQTTAFIRKLARARTAGRALRDRMTGSDIDKALQPNLKQGLGLNLGPRHKPVGEPRFGATVADAEQVSQKIASAIGITRLGLIGELGDLGSIQIAQAARPGNAWSSSYGSGKSRSRQGAIVGAVMEECEKWAQERFIPPVERIGSYAEICRRARAVDPGDLDLPYDSSYRPDLELGWISVMDLISGEPMLMPRDPLILKRGAHDICYSPRGARKHLATNGLGAGLSLEEAILHGLCEYVERHTQRVAELYLSNPGGLGVQPFRFIELHGIAPHIDQILSELEPRADAVRVLDITGEIQIPTYLASIVRRGQVAQGFGTHPNPLAALEAALLEAAQTIASAIAGGREDLSIKARSLGRHERPRPTDPASVWFWLDPDAPTHPLPVDHGFKCNDIYADLRWSVERLIEAGMDHVLVCDLGEKQIEPVSVVRLIIPGLESNNPFYCGPRARLTLLRDLLPRVL
jgi:ribosomal protein S12 methylthiotransferase accessory factor